MNPLDAISDPSLRAAVAEYANSGSAPPGYADRIRNDPACQRALEYLFDEQMGRLQEFFVATGRGSEDQPLRVGPEGNRVAVALVALAVALSAGGLVRGLATEVRCAEVQTDRLNEAVLIATGPLQKQVVELQRQRAEDAKEIDKLRRQLQTSPPPKPVADPSGSPRVGVRPNTDDGELGLSEILAAMLRAEATKPGADMAKLETLGRAVGEAYRQETLIDGAKKTGTFAEDVDKRIIEAAAEGTGTPNTYLDTKRLINDGNALHYRSLLDDLSKVETQYNARLNALGVRKKNSTVNDAEFREAMKANGAELHKLAMEQLSQKRTKVAELEAILKRGVRVR